MSAEQSAPFALAPAAMAERLDGSGRAKAVWSVLRRGGDPFVDEALAPGARARLAEVCRPSPMSVEARSVAMDGTRKLLLRLEDGQAVETVLIPDRDRTTICVSSQVGCARACRFCVTATMGLLRNLSVEEIVGQVVFGLAETRDATMPKLRNIVFMGMGEPLDNRRPVEAAIQLLTSNEAMGFGPRHLTVSTVGTTESAIEAAAAWPGQLAWSLHAADDRIRAELVPTTRAPVGVLLEAFERGLRIANKRTLFVEVALMDGVNDRPSDADAIASLFAHFAFEPRINLLPMNPGTPHDLRPSPPDRVEAFKDRLRGAGLFCSVRRSRGADESSACGQLVAAARTGA